VRSMNTVHHEPGFVKKSSSSIEHGTPAIARLPKILRMRTGQPLPFLAEPNN
jgi:hypothetical protein